MKSAENIHNNAHLGLGDHAILDRPSRLRKGEKIRDLLAKRRPLKNLSVLDVGTGSGQIAGLLLGEVGPNGEVCAVDRLDQHNERGIDFKLTGTTDIPFEDDRFDVVLSNHVIEHVGERESQINHLREIRRVLSDDGLMYLAVPNRRAIWEHHFNLPFLSWLPRPFASWIVRVTGKGTHYDCWLLTRSELDRLFSEADLICEDITIEALRHMAKNEMGPALRSAIGLCPDFLLKSVMPFIPRNVVLGRKNQI